MNVSHIKGGNWSFASTYLSPTAVSRFLGRASFEVAPPRIENVLDAPELARTFVATHKSGTGKSGSDLEAWLIIGEMLSKAIQNTSINKPNSPGARRRAKLYAEVLGQLSDRPFDLQYLAAIGGVSPFQVSRDIKAVYNMTPSQFVRNVKTRAAKDLLMDGASLAEISVCLGFSDQSHFTRAFRSVYGVPPGVYRRKIGK